MKLLQNIFLATIALGVVGCGANESSEIAQLSAVPVTLGITTSIMSEGSFSASGRIEARNSANLSTRMMGNVTKLHVRVGQSVKAGQLLISISSTDLKAKKAQVEASIHQAESAFENARKDYERFKSLHEKGSASQKELDNITTRYEVAKAGLEASSQMMKEVDAQFAFANITAPFTGVVTNTFVKEGDIAAPGVPLAAVEGTLSYQAAVMVPETQITRVKKGDEASVLIKSISKTVKGMVSEISLSAKNTGGQYLVKIDLEDTEMNILSGMFVKATLPKSNETEPDIPVILEKALIRSGQLTGVYTVGEDDIAILRWLRIGKNGDGEVEVLSGMKPGEKYILSADGKLFNGAKVLVMNELETVSKN